MTIGTGHADSDSAPRLTRRSDHEGSEGCIGIRLMVSPMGPACVWLLARGRERMSELAIGPTRESERSTTLDVARGIALLGIFMVNIEIFAAPIGTYIEGLGQSETSAVEVTLYALMATLFEFKSYPLFSILFGIGLAIMHRNSTRAGKPFLGTYVRRLGMLLVVGLAHVGLIWMGDILLHYAIVGGIAVWLAGRSSRFLLTLGTGVILFSAVWVVVGGILLGGAPEAPAEDPIPAPVFEDGWAGFRALTEGLSAGDVDGPADPTWMAAERAAFGEGPFGAAAAMRAVNYLGFTVFAFLMQGLVLHLIGLFFLGMGLLKAGLFEPQRRRSLIKLATVCLAIGLPLSAFVTWVRLADIDLAGLRPIAFGLTRIAGPLMAIGYLGLAAVIAQHVRPLGRLLANTGRLALTNYLMQSIIATALMYHWGLGWFDSTTRPGRIGIVLGVFAFQVVFSTLWLRAFTMGPLEAMLRGVTYLRLPSIRRDHSQPGEGAA